LGRPRAYRRGLADRASTQTRLDGFWALEIPSCASHLTAREQSTAARRWFRSAPQRKLRRDRGATIPSLRRRRCAGVQLGIAAAPGLLVGAVTRLPARLRYRL